MPQSAAATVQGAQRQPQGHPIAGVQAEESWEQVQEETGWSLVACLGHKLSFTKRQDTKTKSEALLAHVKRLRAAGWHLHTLTER